MRVAPAAARSYRQRSHFHSHSRETVTSASVTSATTTVTTTTSPQRSIQRLRTLLVIVTLVVLWGFRTVRLDLDLHQAILGRGSVESSSSSSSRISSRGSASTTTNTPTTTNTKNKKNSSPRSRTKPPNKAATTSSTTSTTSSRTPPRSQRQRLVVHKNYPAAAFANLTVLKHNDPVYQPGPWDGAPIVVEKYKLLFFTIPKVGCTVWKQLFRRVAGYADWQIHQDGKNNAKKQLPHSPSQNGLTYLYHYPPDKADFMLTDPSWTRAIFVRDPKERLLSAYLDKAVSDKSKYIRHHCCPKQPKQANKNKRRQPQVLLHESSSLFTPPQPPPSPKQAKLYQLLQCPSLSSTMPVDRFGDRSSRRRSRSNSKTQRRSPPQLQLRQQLQQQQLQQQQQQQQRSPLLLQEPPSLADFIETVVPACQDPHWRPQSARVSESIWSTINFVGHMDHMETDAVALLHKTGLWQDFGAAGWKSASTSNTARNNNNVDNDDTSIFHGTASVLHATDSAHHLREYYTDALEQAAEKLYQSDYQRPVLNLTLRRIGNERV
jgi:hypothetical protein